MKKILLFLGISITMSVSILAQTSDIQQIETTLNYYLEGGANNDFKTLEKAFHPKATMRHVNEEGYQEVNAVEFFRKAMKPGSKQDRRTRIISMDITGNAASAILEIVFPTFKFIDHMALLKVDGEWKIVNKMFYSEKF